MNTMRRIIALAGLLTILMMVGCTPAKKTMSEKTLLKCSTCGVEFTVEEGMNAYEAAHPQ
jgi:predicted component of type VI protein secretion system